MAATGLASRDSLQSYELLGSGSSPLKVEVTPLIYLIADLLHCWIGRFVTCISNET